MRVTNSNTTNVIQRVTLLDRSAAARLREEP